MFVCSQLLEFPNSDELAGEVLQYARWGKSGNTVVSRRLHVHLMYTHMYTHVNVTDTCDQCYCMYIHVCHSPQRQTFSC